MLLRIISVCAAVSISVMGSWQFVLAQDYLREVKPSPEILDYTYVKPVYVEAEKVPLEEPPTEETAPPVEMVPPEEKAPPVEPSDDIETWPEFMELPLYIRQYLREQLDAGNMPSKEILAKLSPHLREKIISLFKEMEPKDVKGDRKGFDSFISEYWVQFLALIVSLIGVALAVTGFTMAGAKKKKSITRFLHEIDDTFAAFKWKSKRCEAELYRLQDLVEDQLKGGKVDEGTYHLLMSRIDKYLAEIREIDSKHIKP